MSRDFFCSFCKFYIFLQFHFLSFKNFDFFAKCLPIAVRPKVKATSSVDEMLRADLEEQGATAEMLEAAISESKLSGGLMDINDWIDQTLAAKGYIQAQEDREDFIVATGAGATKFNKWMKKAGLVFNKQTGRWTRWSDR